MLTRRARQRGLVAALDCSVLVLVLVCIHVHTLSFCQCGPHVYQLLQWPSSTGGAQHGGSSVPCSSSWLERLSACSGARCREEVLRKIVVVRWCRCAAAGCGQCPEVATGQGTL